MIRRAIVATIAVAVGFGGCGGSKAPPRVKTTAARPEKNAPQSAERLRSALVSADDLGPGWTEIELASVAGPICGIEPLKAPGTTKARAAFGRSDDEGALVRTGVTAYPKGMAAPTLAALRTATTSCATYQLPYTDATGLATQVRVDVRQLEVGDPGDDRLGLRLSLPSLKQVILYGLVRRGDVISAVAQSAEKPDVVAFAPIIARADARLAKLVP